MVCKFARRGGAGSGGAEESMLGVLGWRQFYRMDALRMDPFI